MTELSWRILQMLLSYKKGGNALGRFRKFYRHRVVDSGEIKLKLILSPRNSYFSCFQNYTLSRKV